MPEPPTDTMGSPIKEFIEQARKQSEEGLGDWEFKAPLDALKRGEMELKSPKGISPNHINFV